MLVELINQLWILLFLGHDLLRLLLYVVSIDSHEALHFVSIVLLLHSLLNILYEQLDFTLLFLRHDLRLLARCL